jgi:hypothetical protein
MLPAMAMGGSGAAAGGSLIGSLGGAALGLGGTLIGGMFGKKGRNNIAPGLGKGTAERASEEANRLSTESIKRYMEAMAQMTGDARTAGSDIMGMYNSGAANIRGMGERSTREMQDIYRNFGREAEGVTREEYDRLLANIGDSAAMSRARGGYNSANEMLAAGQRAEAMHGMNRSMADIARERAKLLGDATERGRMNQMQNEGNLLNVGLAARERAYGLPMSIQQAGANTRLQYEHTPEQLYPKLAVRRTILGGQSYVPPQPGLAQEIGGTLANLGGQWMANSKPPSALEAAMTNYYNSK